MPARIQKLNERLLQADSATLALQDWCGAPVRAIKIDESEVSVTGEERQYLQISNDEILNYRKVNLVCRDIILSHAEIWYRTGFLTSQMIDQLKRTDNPFGLVVRPLVLKRETYSVRPLTAPFLFEHRAVLIAQNGRPFGLVRERYTEVALDANAKDEQRENEF